MSRCGARPAPSRPGSRCRCPSRSSRPRRRAPIRRGRPGVRRGRTPPRCDRIRVRRARPSPSSGPTAGARGACLRAPFRWACESGRRRRPRDSGRSPDRRRRSPSDRPHPRRDRIPRSYLRSANRRRIRSSASSRSRRGRSGAFGAPPPPCRSYSPAGTSGSGCGSRQSISICSPVSVMTSS